MTISVTPGTFSTYAAMRTFLTSILPDGTPIIRGQVNRAAEPKEGDFVVMTAIRRERLSTNVDTFIDTRFIASITGGIMNVTEFDYGALKKGSVIFGVNVLPKTQITNFAPGQGLAGIYNTTPIQTLSSRVMAAGVLDALQPTEIVIQLDVHGPNSGDNAQIINTMLRDDYAWLNFKRNTDAVGVAPLSCGNPQQIPFINDQNQVEDRWVVEASLQLNATVNDIPQEFFEQVVIGLIDVDTFYPA